MSPERSFLQSLLDQEASVKRVGEKLGKNVDAAIKEVERQIKQAAQNDPIRGEGVTKSGPED